MSDGIGPRIPSKPLKRLNSLTNKGYNYQHMKQTFFICLLSVCLMIAGAAAAAAQKSTVAGEWDASMNTPGGARPFGLVFKVDGEKVTGTVKRNDGELPVQGTIKGSDLTFSYTINYNGHDLVLTFTGKVTGDTIKGNVDFGGNGGDEWNAKRAAAKPKN